MYVVKYSEVPDEDMDGIDDPYWERIPSTVPDTVHYEPERMHEWKPPAEADAAGGCKAKPAVREETAATQVMPSPRRPSPKRSPLPKKKLFHSPSPSKHRRDRSECPSPKTKSSKKSRARTASPKSVEKPRNHRSPESIEKPRKHRSPESIEKPRKHRSPTRSHSHKSRSEHTPVPNRKRKSRSPNNESEDASSVSSTSKRPSTKDQKAFE